MSPLSRTGLGTAELGTRETNEIFNRNFSKKLPIDIQKIAFSKLRMLKRAYIINDLKVPPDNRLELLHGAREGQYSIRINNQWRIYFKWVDQDAYDVEIVDYH